MTLRASVNLKGGERAGCWEKDSQKRVGLSERCQKKGVKALEAHKLQPWAPSQCWGGSRRARVVDFGHGGVGISGGHSVVRPLRGRKKRGGGQIRPV